MKTTKFWKWKNQTATTPERTLFLNGTIAEESWFDDDVTPQIFKDELMSGSGDITVWINSPGGDCVAAAQIYNMLMDYNGNVTVKIDGIAASAASVIAMAGTKVLVSPVSMLMIHNPITVAMGDKTEMEKAIDMLASVKDSIINAYELKTGLSYAKLSHLMDAETWMDAKKAVELGFADEIISRPSLAKEDDKEDEDDEDETVVETEEETETKSEPDEDDDENGKKKANAMLFSRKAVNNALHDKLKRYISTSDKGNSNKGRSVDSLKDELDHYKKSILL